MNPVHKLALAVATWSIAAPAQMPDLFRLEVRSGWNVLYGHEEFNEAGRMALANLEKLMSKSNAERERIISNLETKAQWEQYRSTTRANFMSLFGSFPQRTPLDARRTGVLERGDYAVEKVIFESRPRFYVTANVYVPRRAKPPFPAVLCPVGHWGTGKAFEDYQLLGIYLARRGFLVLVFDFPGQGERLLYYDSVLGRSLVDPATSEYYVTIEHGVAMGQTILVSGNLAPYLAWDGIRAIDYLCERTDVDRQKIACTGTSGGGLQTETLSALDERIKVSIPVSYGGCAADHPDRVGLSMADVDALIAPRPLLLMNATGDSQSSVAAKRKRYETVAKIYQLLGVPDRIAFVVGEGRHGYLHDLRETAFLWLSKWLLSALPTPASLPEPPTPIESPATLACTATGQAKDSLGGENLLTVNRAVAAQATHTRIRPLERADAAPSWREKLRAEVIARLGFEQRANSLDARILGRIDRGSYILEKLVYYSEPDIYIPSLFLVPKVNGPSPAVLFLNEGGKTANGAPEQFLLPLVKAGYAVLAIDPRGTGETTPPTPPPYNEHNYRGFTEDAEADLFYAALRAHKTVVGLRLLDALRGIDYLESRPEVRREKIAVVGHGSGAMLALYAAALDERIHCAVCSRMLRSYADILDSELYAHRFSNFPPGVLHSYDLADVAAMFAPKPLLLLNPVDQKQQRVDLKVAIARYAPAVAVYQLLGASSRFKVELTDSPKATVHALLRHLSQ